MIATATKQPRLNSPVKYYGGKGRMIVRLRELVPFGHLYCEPCAGGASLFFSRQNSPVEVLNDLCGDVVNLFRVLQCPRKSKRLKRRLEFTPYARAEFVRALQRDPNDNDVERAWKFYVRQNQGFSGRAKTAGGWGRNVTASRREKAEVVSGWQNRLTLFDRYVARLQDVQIEQRDALLVIDQFDRQDAVFYIDPPYAADTRAAGSRNEYNHECEDDWHRKLVDRLLSAAGAVVLSGYDTPLYEPLIEAGWQVTRFQTACHAAGRVRGSKLQGSGNALKHAARTEVVFRNPQAVAMCDAT